MKRREFIWSMAAAAAAVTLKGAAQLPAQANEFYELRKYTLRKGPGPKLTETFFETALIPAANRLGTSSVGPFNVDVGPETPTYSLHLPSSSAEALVTLSSRLADDAEFMKAATGFWDAPASAPAFLRVESSMLAAFARWPKLTAPKREKRILQL